MGRSQLPALPPVGAPITAKDIATIAAKVSSVVLEIDRIDHLAEWLAQAAALEAYLRSRGLQRPILGAQRRIEGRIGQLLGPTHRGERWDVKKTSARERKLVKEDDRFDCRLLGRALAGDCILTDDEWEKSRRALVALVRFRLGMMPETPPLPSGQFHCIVADPPWRLDTGPDMIGGTIESGHDALEYAQLSVDAIADLPVASIAAPDAHLYLWTTNRYVEQSYSIARAWDFNPSALLTWCKAPRGIGLGDTFRQTSEFVLFARRGNLTARRIVERTWFEWPRRAHSVKPDEFYALVESVTPAPYIDLFARRARPNWAVWGAEAPHYAAQQ